VCVCARAQSSPSRPVVMRSDEHRAGMGVVFAAAAACLLAAALLMAGVGREPYGLVSTATVAQVQGSTGHDFVPFGSDGSAKMTATAKTQL